MSQSLTALYLQNPDLAQAIRRRSMGEQMLMQGGDASPVLHPLQGAARLAQALIGGYEQGQADKEIKAEGERQRRQNDEFMQAAMTPYGGAPQQQAAPVAQQPMTAPTQPVQSQFLPPAGVDPDEDLLVRTVYGEARGEPAQGQQAVAAVVRNRAKIAGVPVRDIVFAPGQFEPWGNPQTRAQLEALDPASPEYQQILQNIRAGGDPTGGKTHFYSPTAQAAAGRPPPAWAQGEGQDIGRHRFYDLPYSYRGPAQGAPSGETIPAQMPQGQGAPGLRTPEASAQALQEVQHFQQLAMRAQAAGNHGMATLFMQRAQMAQQMAALRPPTEMVVVATPGSGTGYTYVPRERAAGMAAPEPRPMVSLTNTGEGEWERTRAKDYGERVKGWEDAGVKSTQTLARLQRMEELVNNFTTGAGAGTSITAGQLAQRLGVPKVTVEALGIDPNTIAQGEAIRSLTSQMLVGMLGSGGFPSQGFSNADRDMLERALPSLQNSPQGNKLIIEIMRAGAKRDLEIGQAWRAWSREKGDSLASVRDFQAERLPQITERDVVAPILEGWQEVNPTSAPGAPQEGATASNPQTGQKLRFQGGQWVPVQ